MNLSNRLDAFMIWLEDLARGREVLGGGPFRIEWPWKGLHEIPTELAPVPVVAFHGPVARPSAALAALDAHPVLEANWFDCAFEAEIPDPAGLSADLLGRIGRVSAERPAALPPDDATVDALARLAEAMAGHLLLRLVDDRITADAVTTWMDRLAGTPRLALEVRAAHPESRAALAGSAEALGAAARERGLGLALASHGALSSPRGIDETAPWAILREALRATFRPRLGLCPFPFTMIRRDAEGHVGLCPIPEGPALEQGEGISGWNGAAARATRRAFLEGRPPAPCPSCTLGARLRGSLAREREELESRTGASFPV